MTLPLAPDDLCRRCEPGRLSFETTADLEPVSARFGQDRAHAALEFGLRMRHDGYNVFAMGPAGAGKHTAVRALLDERAAGEPTPLDVCYVNDFATPHKPRALRVPAGKGAQLRADVRQLVEDLRTALSGALETDEFRVRRQALEDKLKERHEKTLHELRERAAKKDIALVSTPLGLAVAPLRGGEVLPPDEFAKLPEEERKRIEADLEALGADLRALVEQMPRFEHEARRAMQDLIRDTLMAAVAHLIDDLKKEWVDHAGVALHLSALHEDVLENAGAFMKQGEGPIPVPVEREEGSPLRRYQVNVLVDHSATKGAPVVYEDHPTFDNLVGRTEHIQKLGTLVTDFNLIKAGALHRANGGYLLLDARNLLLSPYAWEGLKRALFGKQIRLESLGQALGWTSAVSLEPESIPLDVKVVLLGDRALFYLLSALDADFAALFKVVADFEDEIDRSPENDLLYARLVARVVRDEKLRPLDRGAVARVIEESARLAEDSEKLSAHMGKLVDLLREADHWAAQRTGERVSAEDVERALEAQRERAGRLRERVLEQIARGTVLIETRGAVLGQVNGLSVLELGGFAFGRPSRITARVRLGKGDVVDIEREVELGGPIHSKGVLILSGYLGARYAKDVPLSLSATLAFEQSYGKVEGDSASCGELCALLSALGEVPVEQSIAVTGSVNQRGEVQAVGGVNEKIEGFFDVCAGRGLTGAEGVVIPRSNVKHLMLRRDVVQAVREKRFSIWAASDVDEAIEVLTGVPAAAVHDKVEARLRGFAELRAKLAASADGAAARGDGRKGD